MPQLEEEKVTKAVRRKTVFLALLAILLFGLMGTELLKAKNTEAFFSEVKTGSSGSSSYSTNKQIENSSAKASKAKGNQSQPVQRSNQPSETGKTDNKQTALPGLPAQTTQTPNNQLAVPYLKNTVFLTFDDGPSPETEELLNILHKYQAKATFFMLEPNILKYKSAVLRMKQEGQSFGLHGVTHQAKLIYRTKYTVVQEMDEDNAALKRITGEGTSLIRTPYGSYPYMTHDYKAEVKKHGYLLWDWTVDSRDWKYRDARFIKDALAQTDKIQKRGLPIVILLHDRKDTVAHLDEFMKQLKKRGYSFSGLTPNMTPYLLK